MVKRRMWALPALAALAAGGLLRSEYERDHFVVEEARVKSYKVRRERRLVFLTDLHDKEFGEGNSRLLEAVRQAAPDLVLIGGDTMVAKPGRASLEATQRLLEGLAGICPVCYGNGNHEQRLREQQETYGDMYRRFRELLRQNKVEYLSDSSVDIGDDIRVSGLDIDEVYYHNRVSQKMGAAYISRRLGKAAEGRFQVLLAHSPLFADAYGRWGADLALAGHFHGGTIRLPLLGGVMTPQYQFFLPCCGGTFERDGRFMVAGRGLGTHSVNIRLGNKPQVVVVKLLPGEEKETAAEKKLMRKGQGTASDSNFL